MPGLRVFVSSTCFDLGAQRSQIRSLLAGMGYEPVMSDHSDVLFDHRIHTHTSCIKEIINADMVILLIGSRFGGAAVPEALSELDMEAVSKSSTKTELIKDSDRLSITQVEVMKTIELDIPLFAFVDSKVYGDHNLYQKNKKKTFADEIEYPSIEKPETAKYIFEFINLITHRYSNNAIISYANFSDIEDHLLKQWSMMFQRLLREERDKAAESRRSDAILEQIQDLKAAVLQSIGAGAGRDIARSVLRFRRLADLLLALQPYNHDVDIASFQGSFDELLAEFGIVEVRFAMLSSIITRTILVRDDGSHFIVRVPDRRFNIFRTEWLAFSKLEKDTKLAVLDGVQDAGATTAPILLHDAHPAPEDRNAEPVLEDVLDEQAVDLGTPPISIWTDEKLDDLKRLWAEGRTASEIADLLGGVSRNAVIGKAHRLGLQARPARADNAPGSS